MGETDKGDLDSKLEKEISMDFNPETKKRIADNRSKNRRENELLMNLRLRKNSTLRRSSIKE